MRTLAVCLAASLLSIPALADQATPPARDPAAAIARAAGRLTFLVGRGDLTADAKAPLDEIAAWLRAHSEVSALEIGVHTDGRGTAEWNLRLSQARADAVAHALAERGISSGRLVARGYGEARLVADDATEAGRRRNRRVELTPLARR